MSRAAPLDVRQWVKLTVALLVLNVALTFHNVWPTLWVTVRGDLSVEIGVLLLALAAWTSFVRPLGRGARIGLTLLVLALTLGRYAEVTAPALYGRPVNLYWDAQHLPKVVAMLAEVGPWWLVGLLVLGVAALLTGLAAAIAWSCRRCPCLSQRRRAARGGRRQRRRCRPVRADSCSRVAGALFVAGDADVLAASSICRRRVDRRSESRPASRADAALRPRPPRRRRRAADVSRVLRCRDLRRAQDRARRSAGPRRARACRGGDGPAWCRPTHRRRRSAAARGLLTRAS